MKTRRLRRLIERVSKMPLQPCADGALAGFQEHKKYKIDMFNSEEQRQRVLEQLESVRKSGKVNMMDAVGVQRVADENDYHALVSFLGSKPQRETEYVNLLDEFEKYLDED